MLLPRNSHVSQYSRSSDEQGEFHLLISPVSGNSKFGKFKEILSWTSNHRIAFPIVQEGTSELVLLPIVVPIPTN